MHKQNQITIDAAGQPVGRLASKLAQLLCGKNNIEYVDYRDQAEKIEVINVSQIKLSGNKQVDKQYIHHSGHPGGLKIRAANTVSAKERLHTAVSGMLPKNKLRPLLLKKLIIKE